MVNSYGFPTLANCWFSRNTSNYAGAGLFTDGGGGTITNCIFWGNTSVGVPDQIAGVGPTVTYSCVEGGLQGEGNTAEHPMPMDPDGADDVVGTADDNLRLRPGSPCIDAGDNDGVPPDIGDLDGDYDTSEPVPLDLSGNPRFFDDPDTINTGQGTGPIVDMGAHEFQGAPPPMYVHTAATGNNDGTSWVDACTDLQEALNTAASSGTVLEVWVAATPGGYAPAGPGGDRAATFDVPSGLIIYGGFSGWENSLDERDVLSNPTILSGDLNGDDGPGFANNDDNSYHVVTVSSSIPGLPAVIDGCVIEGGNADGSFPNNTGGGLFVGGHEISLRNCIIQDNYASAIGGGAFQYGGGGLSLIGCVIRDNQAGSGGGICTDVGTSSFANCTFVDNDGGGLLAGSGGDISNCIFWGNADGAQQDEDAQIDWSSSAPTVNYCCIQGLTGALGGVGNIGQDPLLERDGFHLRMRSPSRNAGDPAFVPEDGATDIDGQPRVREGHVDMGADEVSLAWSVPVPTGS
jgi:hypothetical protein